MNWWDTKNLTNFASQAIKTATKKIDKVLDIQNDEEAQSQDDSTSSSTGPPNPLTDSFFSNWLGGDPNALPSTPIVDTTSPITSSSALDTGNLLSTPPSASYSSAFKASGSSTVSSLTPFASTPSLQKTTVSGARTGTASLPTQHGNELDEFSDNSLVGDKSPVPTKLIPATKQSRRHLVAGASLSSSGTDSAVTGSVSQTFRSLTSDTTDDVRQTDIEKKTIGGSESKPVDERREVNPVVRSGVGRSETSAFDVIKTRDESGGRTHSMSASQLDSQAHKLETRDLNNQVSSVKGNEKNHDVKVTRMSDAAREGYNTVPILDDRKPVPHESSVNCNEAERSSTLTHHSAPPIATSLEDVGWSDVSFSLLIDSQMTESSILQVETSENKESANCDNLIESEISSAMSTTTDDVDSTLVGLNSDSVECRQSIGMERAGSDASVERTEPLVISHDSICDNVQQSNEPECDKVMDVTVMNSVSSVSASLDSSVETSDSLSESFRTLCPDDSDTPRDLNASDSDTPRDRVVTSSSDVRLDVSTSGEEHPDSVEPIKKTPKVSHVESNDRKKLRDDRQGTSLLEDEGHSTSLADKSLTSVNETGTKRRISEMRTRDEKIMEEFGLGGADYSVSDFGTVSRDFDRSNFVKSFVESNALRVEIPERSGADAGGSMLVVKRNAATDGVELDAEYLGVRRASEPTSRQGSADVEGKSESPRSNASSSSYVKNMLEEAMVESNKDSNTDSHCSEGGIYSEGGGVCRGSGPSSGHTSADEVDTTTSSDIEIISHMSTSSYGFRSSREQSTSITPRGGGGGGQHGPLSDRSHRNNGSWAAAGGAAGSVGSRTRGNGGSSPPGHRRSDSGSSAQSLQEEVAQRQRAVYRRATHDETSTDPQKMSNPYDVDKLLKKLADMAEVLDARERRQMQMSEENVSLVEANNVLRNQLQQLEQSCEAEMEDLKAVTDEFTRRIGEGDKRFQAVSKERDSLKKHLQDAEADNCKRADYGLMEKLLKEKEQIIAELLEEGEKLSKQQLNSNNIVKKLRNKEKETDQTNKSLKQRVDEQKLEIERLEGILENKVDVEKKNSESITQLNAFLKTLEDETNRLKNELEDSTEKCRSMKVALDSSYKEISELHKARVTHVSEIHASAMSAEMQAKEQLKQTLDERQLKARREQESLVTQIEDLQLSLSRLEKEGGRREDMLRQEISDLHQRLQEAEERNQDLTQNMSAATRPLLRQIESLQSTHAVQLSNYERVEKSISDRLMEGQMQLLEAMEKERSATERLQDATARLAGVESHLSSLRQDKSRLQAQLEVERSKLELMEEAKHNDTAQKDAFRHKYEHELTELKKEKILLENLLDVERMRSESEVKKVALVHEQLREKEMLLSLRRSPSFSRESSSVSDSIPAPITPMNSSMIQEDKAYMLTSAHGHGRMSLYESMRQSNASLLLDSLQSQLKQREGEIAQLQSDITELEHTREAMAREMVSLSMKNEKQEDLIQTLSTFQQKHAEIESRYNALLQMYGEKVEETQELKYDLQDVKDMYKIQIDELLQTKSKTRGDVEMN